MIKHSWSGLVTGRSAVHRLFMKKRTQRKGVGNGAKSSPLLASKITGWLTRREVWLAGKDLNSNYYYLDCQFESWVSYSWKDICCKYKWFTLRWRSGAERFEYFEFFHVWFVTFRIKFPHFYAEHNGATSQFSEVKNMSSNDKQMEQLPLNTRLPQSKDISSKRRLSSDELMAGKREIVIEHGGEEYRLRITSKEKLILTK